MTVVLPLLRFLWKPVLGITLMAGLYLFGFGAGKSAARVDQLIASNERLTHQIEATARIAETAAFRAKLREQQLYQRNKWIEDYAEDIRKRADQCTLNDDDVKRLQRL